MKFLVIAQDLRVSGTSEGIVSRSFIANLRNVYPNAVIDVLYTRMHESDDQLDILPVDSITTHEISRKIPFGTLWANKISWRLFNVSLKSRHIQNNFAAIYKKTDFDSYDTVFLRSSGIEYENILGANGLSFLSKSVINFHDPYPNFWDTGATTELTGLELFRLKEMREVVMQAKQCISPSLYLSQDLERLYRSPKKFEVLPHQFNPAAFDLSDTKVVRKKQKTFSICYHGSLQLGRDVEIVLDAYQNIVEKNPIIKEQTEFVLRLKSNKYEALKKRYIDCTSIVILESVNFSNSIVEQLEETDVAVILENTRNYSNILPGKVPVAAYIDKSVLAICPEQSETRRLMGDDAKVLLSTSVEDIEEKLTKLLTGIIEKNVHTNPLKDYFSLASFKSLLSKLV